MVPSGSLLWLCVPYTVSPMSAPCPPYDRAISLPCGCPSSGPMALRGVPMRHRVEQPGQADAAAGQRPRRPRVVDNGPRMRDAIPGPKTQRKLEMSSAPGSQILFHRNTSFTVGPERNGFREWIIFPADGPIDGGDSGVSGTTGNRGSFRNAVHDAEAAIDHWLGRNPSSEPLGGHIASRPHPEIIRAKFLVAQSRLLMEIARARSSDLADEIIRADNLTKIASELLSTEVQDVLIALPQDGSWASGVGPYSKIINEMLGWLLASD